MEEKIINGAKAKELMEIPSENIRNRIKVTGKAKRWFLVPKGNESLGSIVENIIINADNGYIPEERLEKDRRKLEIIRERYEIE